MHSTITPFDNTGEGWERSLDAFPAEKERRRDVAAMPPDVPLWPWRI